MLGLGSLLGVRYMAVFVSTRIINVIYCLKEMILEGAIPGETYFALDSTCVLCLLPPETARTHASLRRRHETQRSSYIARLARNQVYSSIINICVSNFF